jgi:hypothetical protein
MQTQQVQTLEAIEHNYHEQWVLVKETEWDKRGNPITDIYHRKCGYCETDTTAGAALQVDHYR